MSSSSSSPPQRKCQRVSLKEIEDATENFNERYALGQGGEAKVYLAQIILGRSAITQVAVKYLKPNSTTGFEDEIQIMPRIQHPNIVSLLGYCNDSGQKILIYEYMAHGSLADYVQKKQKPTTASSTTAVISLSWLQRLKICLGAALGLKHLHTETKEFAKGVIHRDVKPSNILLDANWVAKVSDFGLFKLSPADQFDSEMSTTRKGTSGYYAPEYLKYRHVTRKVDVYAFGVVLFQVLCRKMPWDRGDESYYEMEDEDLGEWARQNVDSKIRGEISDYCLNTFTEIIRKSLSVNPKKRPTMDEVVLTLQNALEGQQLEAAIEAEGCRGHALSLQPRSPGPGSRMGTASTSPLHPRFNGPSLDSPNLECHPLPLPPPPSSPMSSSNLQNSRASGLTENLHVQLSKWEKVRHLGRGAFGHVYLGLNSESGQMCTIKEVRVDADDLSSKKFLKQLNQEINLLNLLSHQNIVQYYGSKLSDESLSIYLEYVSGESIDKLLQEYGAFREPVIQNYTRQILSGLAYLHSRNTEHRNIQGKNMLVDPKGEIKLGDFGMKTPHIASCMMTVDFTLSPNWMAPEVVMNKNGYSLAVDIWSLGCTVLEMATSKPPWGQYEQVAAIFKIVNSKDIPEIPDHLSIEAKSFIMLCLQRDPSARPSASKLLDHPFVRDQATT